MSTAHSMLAPRQDASGRFVQGTEIHRPRMFQDITDFQAEIHAYFAGRDAAEKPYTMHGLARQLGCSRATLLRYEEYNDAAPFCEAIKAARERVAEWTEDRLHTKGFHPAGAIFSLKNNFGWSDVQVVQHQGGVLLGVVASDEQRRALVPQLEVEALPASTIAQIANENGVGPPCGDQAGMVDGELADGQTFASEASLSPVPRNSYAVDK